MLPFRKPATERAMTRRQAERVALDALALGWETAIPEVVRRGRYKLVLTRREGAGTIRMCAWSMVEWKAMVREEAHVGLAF